MAIFLRNSWNIKPTRWGSDADIIYAIKINHENNGLPYPIIDMPFWERSGKKIYSFSQKKAYAYTINGVAFWSFNGLIFNGTANWFKLQDLTSYFSNKATVIMELELALNTPTVLTKTGIGILGTAPNISHYPYTDGGIYLNIFRNDRLTLGNIGIDKSIKHLFSVTTKPGSNNWKFYQNGKEYYNATGLAAVYFPVDAYVGLSYYPPTHCYLNGIVYKFSLYNEALTAAQNSFINSNRYFAYQKVSRPIYLLPEIPSGTRQKRTSVANYFNLIMPVADGTINSADREHAAGLYMGIPAQSLLDVGVPILGGENIHSTIFGEMVVR